MLVLPYPFTIFTARLNRVSAGGTYDDADDEPVDSGRLLVATHVSFENGTTAFTSLRVGVCSGFVFHVHEEELPCAAAQVYWMRSPLIIGENQFLRARFTGCTSGDALIVEIQGLLYDLRCK